MSLNKIRVKKISDGFTLIETLVAIAILSAALASPMVLAIRNVGVAAVSQDQLVAFYLSQEVLEYVRNVRDTNILSGRTDGSEWLTGLENCLIDETKTNGCQIDATGGSEPTQECVSGCEPLKFNSDTGLYNYGDEAENKNTTFIRTVKIQSPVNGNENEAIVRVSTTWTGKYGAKTLDLQDNIFNWR
ncbi:prepilin-type N-terminal cleavage/methylation domain-containing protein [Candidatus Parcubacteria bacterium]|nr:MAG: prepilin-type N-terminal cleavage/methylation domain-containing protein [Candidatus Parcubacteria bacterium]